MSSDDVKRSVRTSRHDRAAGDAPSMGRVARMPGTGLPRGLRRKRKKSEHRQGGRVRKIRGQIIKVWSILLSALVLVVLGIALWLWIIPQMKPDEPIAGTLPADAVQTALPVPKFPSPSQTDAIAMVKQGLAVRDPEKIPEFFRLGTSSTQEIVVFLENLKSRDGVIDHLEWLGSMDANGLLIDGVVVNFTGMDKPRNRLALLTPNEAGRWQIDFDAFARTVKPAWPELLEKQAQVAEVRVYAAKDSYHNGPFRDDKQWVCFGIGSPDTDQVLLAYAKTGSPQAAAMRWIFSKDSRMSRTTLEIRRVPDGEPRQFEISRVLAEDWVVGAVPFDDGFK